MPLTWYGRHGAGQGRVEQVCKQLEELFYAAEPATIVTSECTYSSMAIKNLTFSKSLDAVYAIEIPIFFGKLRITQAATTSIPDSYGKSGTNNAQAGTANATSGSSGSS